MKKSSLIALIISVVAVLLSIYSCIQVSILRRQIQGEAFSGKDNNFNETITEHPFDQTLVGTWNDSEWVMTISDDSSVYLEQIDDNSSKSYLAAAPRLLVGYIENNAIVFTFTSDCTAKEYSLNPEECEKEECNVSVTLIREATDSFKIEYLEWQNRNFSFRRIN